MKSQVYDIEAQMAVLSQKTLEITDAASKINQALDGNRNKMNQLSNAHAIISKVRIYFQKTFVFPIIQFMENVYNEKLNFIFELPTKLRQSVKQKQFTQAVLYSSRTAKMLSRYKHMPIFQKIEEECSIITGDIGEATKEKMVSPDVGLVLCSKSLV
jgi:hypothetical protein